MPDRPREFHTIVIGAGSGGLTVAVGLAAFGKTVALVERRHVGGDCTNTGCIPSKTLIHLAGRLSGDPAERAPAAGAEVLAEVRRKRDALRDEETEEVRELERVTLVTGHATLTGAHTVRVAGEDGSEDLRAANIVIASGSRPQPIPIDGLPAERLLTSETLWDLATLPEGLAIVGGGVVGCEMAFALHKLGVRVAVVEVAPRLLSTLEPEASALIERRMEEAGIAVHLEAETRRYRDGALHLEQPGRELAVAADAVLVAVGRTPNLDLGLDAAGVAYDARGIFTDALGRTSVASVYAIGDVDHRSAFTHSANSQGRRLVQKLALPWLPLGPKPVWPSATFTDPEVAQVGAGLDDLRRRYHPELIRSVRVDLSRTDRGYTMGLGPEHGFVLIHAMRLSGRVLSATIVAPGAGEMIPLLTLAVDRRIGLYRLANLVFPYPVLSEAIKKAADRFVFDTLPDLAGELTTYLRFRFRRGVPRGPDAGRWARGNRPPSHPPESPEGGRRA